MPLGLQFVPDVLLQFPPILLPVSVMTRWMPRTLQSFLIANRVLPLKTAPSMDPQPGISRRQLLESLRRVRQHTLRVLEPAENRDLSHLYWQHPLMGTRNIYQILELLADHDRRHRLQIRTTVSRSDFPKARS